LTIGEPTTPAERDALASNGLEVDGTPDATKDLHGVAVAGAVTDGDGQLNARRDAPVGGQAVLEGVMMPVSPTGPWRYASRPQSSWPRASARPRGALGEIEVTTFPLTSALKRHRISAPAGRTCVVALGGSLAIGFRAGGLGKRAASSRATVRGRRGRRDAVDAEAARTPSRPTRFPRALWRGRSSWRFAFAISCSS